MEGRSQPVYSMRFAQTQEALTHLSSNRAHEGPGTLGGFDAEGPGDPGPCPAVAGRQYSPEAGHRQRDAGLTLAPLPDQNAAEFGFE